MVNVLVNMPVDPAQLEKLQSMDGVRVHVVPQQEGSNALPAELLRDQHLLFCYKPPGNLADCASLKLIQICSAGYGQLIDIGLNERGIRACNASGVFDLPIAEWNVTMMIQLARDMKRMTRNQERKIWDAAPRFQAEIRGTRAGFWGYGGFARETARLLTTMGVYVQVLVRKEIKSRENNYCTPGTGDPQGRLPDKIFVEGQELEFLSDLDFLIVALPLTKATKGLIGERELGALPSTAFILNPARGPIIQEQALLQALRENRIGGAALDTHYYYPMPNDHPLWEFPNVIMTPHISGGDQNPYFLPRIWDLFTENVRRYMANEPLLNELSHRELDGY